MVKKVKIKWNFNLIEWNGNGKEMEWKKSKNKIEFKFDRMEWKWKGKEMEWEKRPTIILIIEFRN